MTPQEALSPNPLPALPARGGLTPDPCSGSRQMRSLQAALASLTTGAESQHILGSQAAEQTLQSLPSLGLRSRDSCDGLQRPHPDVTTELLADLLSVVSFLDLAVIREYCDIHEVTNVVECAAMGLGLEDFANASQVVGGV